MKNSNIKKIGKHLFKIFDYDNLLEIEFARKKLDVVSQLKKELPQEVVEKIDFFIDAYVTPLMVGSRYYDFIALSFGKYTEGELFRPNSELSACTMVLLIHSHCLFLQSRLIDYFNEQFDIYIDF